MKLHSKKDSQENTSNSGIIPGRLAAQLNMLYIFVFLCLIFNISALSSDKNLILVFDPLYKISTIFSLGSILHTVLPSPFLTLFNIRPPFEMFYEICYLSTTWLPYGNIGSKKNFLCFSTYSCKNSFRSFRMFPFGNFNYNITAFCTCVNNNQIILLPFGS